MADQWLNELRHQYPDQRTLHPGWIEAYAQDMRNGLFGPSDFHFAVYEDWEPLVNGRHRCSAVLASNVTIRARRHDIPLSKREDAGTVYSWFDTAGGRTLREILAAMGTKITPRLLNVTQNACSLIVSGFEPVPVATGKQVRSASGLVIKQRAIEDWAPFATGYLGVIGGCSVRLSQILRRQTVMSVGMVTMRYCEERAIPFWTQLALNDVRPKTPQSLLMELFLKNKRATAYPAHHWARFVAHAWNHYYQGNSLTIFRLGDDILKLPIEILGTPYDGKKARELTY